MTSARAAQLNPLQKRSLERWYPLSDHKVQLRLIASAARFKVVAAGRRSGKTERAKRYLAKQLMQNSNEHYFIAAPTRPQVKKIYWEDMKTLCFANLLNDNAISESELMIKMPNGSTLTLIGLDQPQRIEGAFWSGGIIDEIADIKANAWSENISPALDTFNPSRPDYRPWCWIIGVPNGLNHFYDIAEYAKSGDPDWEFFTWHSSDILPEDIVKAAQKRLSPKHFKQEYEASFETASGRIYEDYSKANATSEEIQSHEQLLWAHDFNYSPMSSCVCVVRDNALYILDEIILTSATSRQAAEEFVDRYQDHKNKEILLFGDPAGRAGEKHGHASDYTEITEVLKNNGFSIKRKVKPKAPAIRDRQNAVRAKILNAYGTVSLFVNLDKCKYAHKGLATTQLKEGSSFLEKEDDYQHITTAIGYLCDFLWPISIYKESPEVNIIKTAHKWSKKIGLRL